MVFEDGEFYFGFCEGMVYGEPTDKFEDFYKYKNDIPKDKIIKHMESALLGLVCSTMSCVSYDRFTGEEFNSGMYQDGIFNYPVDFVRYLKTQDIGVPYEYEDYLKTVIDY